MDFIVKDPTFAPVAVIDTYESAIWTERYTDLGDFELQLPLERANIPAFVSDNYLVLPGDETDRAMIIEYMQIDSDISTGKKTLVVKGHSLEAILKRRIVWRQTQLVGLVETVIRQILNENVISPTRTAGGRTYTERTIPNFSFPTITDPVLLAIIGDVNIDVQFTGDTVYDAIKMICEKVGIGFKITFGPTGNFIFSLYCGYDRTINQNDRDAIIFSPDYDTLISSRYVSNTEEYKNVALVLGKKDSDENARPRVTVYSSETEPSGLDRRELYVDANNVETKDENGNAIASSTYLANLRTEGLNQLKDAAVTSVFDGQVETHIGPKYGRDYFLGDFVSTVNEFGLGAKTQITEYIRAFDKDGYKAYPTFLTYS